MDVAERPFSVYLPIEKAYESEDGQKWVFEGPLTEPSEDLEEEEMDSGDGIEKGLQTFDSLGRIVDWEHLYERTLDPDYIMGTGVERFRAPHPVTKAVVPWLKTEFHKDSKYAQKAVAYHQRGGKLGYSLAGGVKRREGKRIVEPIISTVAVTARPVQSKNVGTLQLAKALRAYTQGAEFAALDLPIAPEIVSDLPCIKAITACGSLPRSGPSASAVGTEQVEGRASSQEEPEKKKKRKEGDQARADGLTPIRKALMEMLADELEALLAG